MSGALSAIAGLVSGSSLSGMMVFHNTITILMGASVQSMVDVTQMLPPMSMLSIHYEDPISFQADTLDLTFADIGDQIIKSTSLTQSVTLKKGVWVKVKIDQWNRDYPGSHVQRDLGSFQIDQIKHSWPPSQTTLMASSVPIGEQIKLTLQNKTRLTANLKDLASQVAAENHLGFQWNVKANSPQEIKSMSQAQQWNESDLQMLSRYLRSNALSMKIKDINGKQTLVVFDEQDLEKGPPVYTIDFSLPGAGIQLIHGELTTQSQDIYSGSELADYDPNTNTFTVGKADAPPETADGTKEQLKIKGLKFLHEGGAGEDIAVPGD